MACLFAVLLFPLDNEFREVSEDCEMLSKKCPRNLFGTAV